MELTLFEAALTTWQSGHFARSGPLGLPNRADVAWSLLPDGDLDHEHCCALAGKNGYRARDPSAPVRGYGLSLSIANGARGVVGLRRLEQLRRLAPPRTAPLQQWALSTSSSSRHGSLSRPPALGPRSKCELAEAPAKRSETDVALSLISRRLLTRSEPRTQIIPVRSAVRVGPQISQSSEFKALRKPPNSLSRQGSIMLAAFEGCEMTVRLTTVAFSDLGRATVVTFLGLCR